MSIYVLAKNKSNALIQLKIGNVHETVAKAKDEFEDLELDNYKGKFNWSVYKVIAAKFKEVARMKDSVLKKGKKKNG